ncbi:MAG: NnrS family protein [Paracoccus sp. (in: a-proteobacteria)]
MTPRSAARTGLRDVLSDEGFRLFFPLAALYAAFWPLLWVGLWSFDLPLARDLPASVWHGYEMVFGAWGAALIGFLTTAAPEWTDTARLRGRPLWILAGLWAVARFAGLIGADILILPAALADLGWLLFLPCYLLVLSWRRGTTRVLAFAGWTLALALAGGAARIAMLHGNARAASDAVQIAGMIYLGLLGLVLARVTVPVTNIVLDPTETSSPFRPHPGRLNLAPGLVALAVAGQIWGLSPAVHGYLWIAAGAGFMDRVTEGFVGRASSRAEIMVLAGAAGFAGIGLLCYGAALLGASWGEAGPLHLIQMGGLGLGVLAVLAIAGRFHTGQGLGLNLATRAAFAMLALASLLRALPEMGLMPWPPGPVHLLAAVLWAGAFLAWLSDYWSAFRDPTTIGGDAC